MQKMMVGLLCCMAVCFFACEQQTTADDVVAKVVEASGGAEKLQSIQDQVSKWDFRMSPEMMPMDVTEGEAMMSEEEEMMGEEMMAEEMPEGEMMEEEMAGEEMMSMPMVITYKRPDMIRMDFKGPDGGVMMSSAYNGASAWEMHMGQVQMKPEIETEMDATMAKTWIDGFLNYEEKGLTIEKLPNETIDGRECYVLKVTDENGHAQTYYIDTGSNLAIRQSGKMLNMEKELEQMYMTFGDYDKVDGLAMAHHVALYKDNGDLVWEATLEEVQHNTGVADDFFTPPDMTTMK